MVSLPSPSPNPLGVCVARAGICSISKSVFKNENADLIIKSLNPVVGELEVLGNKSQEAKAVSAAKFNAESVLQSYSLW